MTSKNLRTRYSEELKEFIVALSKTGSSTNSLAREYGVRVSTVSKWINQADPSNNKILSENKRLKEELYILKRAAELLEKN